MIPVERAHMHVAARSHPGMSGKNNEDRYAVSAFQVGSQRPVPSVLAVVSDGIGGHRAGEVAAEIAVETISQAIAASNSDQPVQTLHDAVIRASQAIYLQSEKDLEQKGMGATCVCAWVVGNRLYTACVGDSRIYLIRGDTIYQLSTDHTWIQEAIEHGALTREEARGHPNAHVIRRYLGSRQPAIPDLRLRLNPEEDDDHARSNQGVRLLTGDQVVLCSDGLTDLVNDYEMLSILKTKSQEEALDELVNLANQRGGHDNITLITLRMPEVVPQAMPAALESRQWGWRWACLGVSALLLVGAVLAGGLYWFTGNPFGTQSPALGVTQPPSPPTSQQIVPALTVASQTIPALSTTPAIVLPSIQPVRSPSPTAPLATLTPWPTNTKSP